MSYKFEMSNVKDSLSRLYQYIAEIAGEDVWKKEPIITDSSAATVARFPHPAATAKEIKANSEPFSNITVTLSKPYAAQAGIEFAYDSKKALVRFGDLLKERNKSICDEFFRMVNSLNGFTFKIQEITTYKKAFSAQCEDVFTTPASSVCFNDVEKNIKKVIDACNSKEMTEDEKPVKYRGPRISISRDFSIDELALENTPFDSLIKALHGFMLSEPKISSDKDVAASIKERKQIEGKIKFRSIISNRANSEFYCRLSKAELERIPESVGVQVWNIENFEEKKYIRGALKLVREI